MLFFGRFYNRFSGIWGSKALKDTGRSVESKLGNKEGAWVGIPFGATRALVLVLERGRGEGVEGDEGAEWIGVRMRGRSGVA